jgi:hypothetical protein
LHFFATFLCCVISPIFNEQGTAPVINKNRDAGKPNNGLQIKHEADAGERKKKSYRLCDGEMMRSRCSKKNTWPQREP